MENRKKGVDFWIVGFVREIEYRVLGYWYFIWFFKVVLGFLGGSLIFGLGSEL